MGIFDWIACFPFASVIQYSLFNIENRFEYIVAPWYNYLVYNGGRKKFLQEFLCLVKNTKA